MSPIILKQGIVQFAEGQKLKGGIIVPIICFYY